MIEAKIICDSIGEHSPRITTFQLRYPKFIHGEFMTHRMFSRNASSSRAIPVTKNLEEVRSDELRAAPVWWGREQKGMKSGEELSNNFEEHNSAIFNSWLGITNPIAVFRRKPPKDDTRNCYLTKFESANQTWKEAALKAADAAQFLNSLGAHKSIVNRLLEPFLHINVVVTSCEPGLLNFFGLRLDKAAQPEIRALAEKMWAAWQESELQKLQPGQWHLPFVDDDDEWQARCDFRFLGRDNNEEFDEVGINTQKIKVSVARCARVSYISHETGKRSTIEEDLALYDRLVGSQPLHASPAEHQATPDSRFVRKYDSIQDHVEGIDWFWNNPNKHGNLPGWIQYRKTLPGEDIAPLPGPY